MPKRAYLLGIGGLVLGLFAGFSIASESVPPAQAPSDVAPPLPLQAPTKWTIPGDGVYLVGDTRKGADVRPGLYHGEDNRSCAWRTAEDATFEDDSVTASDTVTGDGYVQLRAGVFFDTNGCTTWRRATGPGAPR
jgi:hypothetical protein